MAESELLESTSDMQIMLPPGWEHLSKLSMLRLMFLGYCWSKKLLEKLLELQLSLQNDLDYMPPAVEALSKYMKSENQGYQELTDNLHKPSFWGQLRNNSWTRISLNKMYQNQTHVKKLVKKIAQSVPSG